MTGPRIDVARFLPPAMRGKVANRPFSWLRLVLWLGFAAALVMVSQHGSKGGFKANVAVSGREEFEIGRTQVTDALFFNGTAKIVAVGLNEARLEGWVATRSDEGITLTHPTQPGFRMKRTDDGFNVYDTSDKLVSKVKLKDDKFNLYDDSDTRIGHGKEKGNVVIMRDQNDSEAYRVRGASLDEAPILFLTIPLEARVVAWYEREALRKSD